MGINYTPLSSLPHSGGKGGKLKGLKSHFNSKTFVLLSVLVLFVGVVSGYLAMSSGIFYKSNASGGFSPIDRRAYENCYQPFQTKAAGASIFINNDSNCQNLPKISIDVWEIESDNFNDQDLVWHGEFTVKPGSNILSIPQSVYNCKKYYQIDTWFGTGTPPSGANYGYSLITASFVKPAGSSNYGPIPSQYRDGTTVDGVACTVTPSNTPTPKPSDTPTPKPTKTPTPIPTNTPKPTNTPIPTATPTLSPKCGSSCTSSSNCPSGMSCSFSSSGTNSSPSGVCVLSECLKTGVSCSEDKCVVIPPTKTPTPSPTTFCPKPNAVKNLRIICPTCQQ